MFEAETSEPQRAAYNAILIIQLRHIKDRRTRTREGSATPSYTLDFTISIFNVLVHAPHQATSLGPINAWEAQQDCFDPIPLLQGRDLKQQLVHVRIEPACREPLRSPLTKQTDIGRSSRV